MKNPESALPWFYDGNFDGTVTTPGDYVFQDCLKEDAEYIVQACNNFPKAVELLQEAKNQIEYLQGKFSPTGTREAVLSHLKAFLESLE